MKKSICLFAATFVFLFTVSAISTASTAAEYTPDSNAPRSSVPDVYKWDTSVLFKSDGAWHAALADVRKRASDLQVYRGKLTDASVIRECLDKYADAKLIVDRIGVFMELKPAEDDEVEKYQKMYQQSQEFSKEFNTKTSFIREELLRKPEAEMNALLSSDELKKYADYLREVLRRKSHLLSEDGEKILLLAGDNLMASSAPTSDIEMIFKSIMRDIKFPMIKDDDGKEVELNLSNYTKYRSSNNREVRKGAVEAFFKTFRSLQNIYTSALAGEFRRDIFFSLARKYPNSVSAYLDVENVDPKVMDNLISTVHKNLKPLHRYVELKKKALGVKDLHLYDIYAPLTKTVDVDVPYSEAEKYVLEALKPLGDDYLKTAQIALKPGTGWTDVYPNKGKESGAFSTAAWGVHPFIKMNYQNNIDDVSTLAHELGHTMHSHLNMTSQPYPYFGYSTFTAEIASTINEKFLTNYLLEKYKDNDDMRLYILGNLLEDIRTTIYRQTLFAEFEKTIHEAAEKGIPLTAELLNKTYIGLIKKYYGSGFSVGEYDDIEWAFIPHFYYKYYVYAYATGLSSGISLAEKIEKEGDKARDAYLAMLKEPITAPPLDILKKAGVDLTKPDAIESAIRLMDKTIDEIEKIMAKRK